MSFEHIPELFNYNIDDLRVEPKKRLTLFSQRDLNRLLKEEMRVFSIKDFVIFAKIFISHQHYTISDDFVKSVVFRDYNWEFDCKQFALCILYLLQCKVPNIQVYHRSTLLFIWNESKMALVFKSTKLEEQGFYFYIDCVFNALLNTEIKSYEDQFSSNSDMEKVKVFISSLKHLDTKIEQKYLNLIPFGEELTHLSIRLGSAKFSPFRNYHENIKNLKHFRYAYPIDRILIGTVKLFILQNSKTLETLTLCLTMEDGIIETIALHCQNLRRLRLRIIIEAPNDDPEQLFSYLAVQICGIKTLEKLTLLSISAFPQAHLDLIKAALPDVEFKILPHESE